MVTKFLDLMFMDDFDIYLDERHMMVLFYVCSL